MKLVHPVGHRVGERIFLRVDGAGLDGGDRLGQIPAQRHGAEQLEGARLHLARQHADAHAGEVGGGAHRPQLVGDLAEAVLVPAEDAVVHPFLDLLRQKCPELAVDARARGVVLREQERQVDEAELRHAVGQVA